LGGFLVAALAVAFIIDKSSENHKNDENHKIDENTENKETDEKDENQLNHVEIDEETRIYLKSLLSPTNISCIRNNHNLVKNCDENDISNLLPFTMCSMNIEANLVFMILSYLPIENIMQIQTIDEKFCALSQYILNNRKYLRCCARRGFYNRPIVWPWIAAQSLKGYQDFYVNKLGEWSQIQAGEIENKEFKDTRNALEKDIHRTFSSTRTLNLSPRQQCQLQTLLGVYSLLDPEVGYVQGMNFIAGTIVLAVEDELDAFAIFCQLMQRAHSIPISDNMSVADTENSDHNNKRLNNYSYCAGGHLSKTHRCGYGLRDMFTQCLPGYTIALLEFEQLFQKHLPILYCHMKNEGLMISSFASEWFITLYAYVLPLSITYRIYDLFLIDGWKILHRIGLAILSLAENTLLTSTLDDIIMYLKQFPDSGIFISREDEDEGDTFIEHAFSFKITNYGLHTRAVSLL